MLIAFEGPDETGKSLSATELDSGNSPFYNANRENYAEARADVATATLDYVRTFDRIDWFTHMVYRLAMPTRDWNDDRVRTVFAMPDTHLVVKLHAPDKAVEIGTDDEPYAVGDLHDVNNLYAAGLNFLFQANHLQDYALFKTISVMQVDNDQTGALHSFTQRLLMTAAPDQEPEPVDIVMTNRELLEYLSDVNHRLL